ncbi:MAG: hypothetical protein J0H78_12380 [Rhizobiales bacterium]|nr:hypothetical protein [Hyphomicrobiales bacterium]OJY47040.1 MAG: hypothetical protein BGP08_03285 [Rhizobiales bacterium 64-17]
MPMLQTAEFVAAKNGLSRERQDEYSLISQQRTAAAQQEGRFDAEIVPITAAVVSKNKDTGEVTYNDVTLSRDEGNRPDTTLQGLRNLKPVIEYGTVTGGNPSRFLADSFKRARNPVFNQPATKPVISSAGSIAVGTTD